MQGSAITEEEACSGSQDGPPISNDGSDNISRKKPKKNRGCYHCGASTHRAKECPKATCQLCGSQGHAVGGCPQKAPPPVDRGSFSSGHSDNKKTAKFTFVELFAGMGGFRVALDRLGGHCVFASEMDRFCVANYQLNFGGDRPAGDITRIETDWIPDHDIVCGGFPCQQFSSSGKKEGMKDPKGQLFREIVRILRDKQPKAFLLENVRGLYLHDSGKTFQVVVKELEGCGYTVKWQLMDAVNLLPQERCRLFIVGIRRDLQTGQEKQCKPYQFPELPRLNRGVQDILQGITPQDQLSEKDLESLTLSPHQESKVRAQKYTQEHPEARFLQDTTEPAKTLQSSYTKYMVGSQFVPTTNNDNNDSHNPPPAWRRFSSREAARLQGFPETFCLCRERPYHMLGNAVAPPLVAMIVAPLLHYIGVACQQPGWTTTKELLLDAMPNDERRNELRRKLENVDQREEAL